MKKLGIFASSLLLMTSVNAQDPQPYVTETITLMDSPWALEFMPDGRMLITEKSGNLMVVTQQGEKSSPITGIPAIDSSGQGGLGDVVLHPDFENNNMVYLSFSEAGENDTRGGAVGRGVLNLEGNGGNISDFEVIWRQFPKVSGNGHYSNRLGFSPDGYLFISSGDRQTGESGTAGEGTPPSQDLGTNLGKMIRLNDDGSLPADNPFADQGGTAAQVWSWGHRNLTGFDFDSEGLLWQQEMGPWGGDELNQVEKGENYGYPYTSDGNHYDGNIIVNHDNTSEYAKPMVSWNPVISPGGMVIYDGDEFSDWDGNILIAGLSSRALIRVGQRFGRLTEVERYNMGARIRDVEQGPEGTIWLLMDGATGGLLKLTAP